MKKKTPKPRWYKIIFFLIVFLFGIGATISTTFLIRRGENISLNVSIIFILLFLAFPKLFFKGPFKFYGIGLKDIRQTNTLRSLVFLLLLLMIFLGTDFFFASLYPQLPQLASEPEVSRVHSGAAIAKAITPLPTGLFLILEFIILLVDTFTEELLFRGIIEGGLLVAREKILSFNFRLNSFVEKWGLSIIIFIQALLFGIVHWTIFNPLGAEFTPLSFYSGAYSFIFGLVAGWLFYRRKSILPSLYLHFFINFFSVVLSRI